MTHLDLHGQITEVPVYTVQMIRLANFILVYQYLCICLRRHDKKLQHMFFFVVPTLYTAPTDFYFFIKMY